MHRVPALLRLRPCRFSGPHGAGPRARTGRTFAENDHPEHLVLGDIGHGSRANDLPVLHHHYAVREVKHVMDIVADQKDAAGFSMAALMAASSVFQRSSWKFDQLDPTTGPMTGQRQRLSS